MRAPGTMPSMRFQFSILTMVVCTAAIALATCWAMSDTEFDYMHFVSSPTNIYEGQWQSVWRKPTGEEIAWRLAWAWPLATFIALRLLSASRQIVKRHFMRGRV
jgi:hypothetical protein